MGYQAERLEATTGILQTAVYRGVCAAKCVLLYVKLWFGKRRLAEFGRFDCPGIRANYRAGKLQGRLLSDGLFISLL